MTKLKAILALAFLSTLLALPAGARGPHGHGLPPSPEDESVSAGQMWTGAKSKETVVTQADGIKFSAAKTPFIKAARFLAPRKEVPAPSMPDEFPKEPKRDWRKLAGILLAAVAIFGIFGTACGLRVPSDPCEPSRNAVARTIDAINKTDAAVGKVEGAIESAAANQDNRFGDAGGAVRDAEGAISSAQKYLTKAEGTAANCGPEASAALSEAKDALAKNQPALDGAKQALNTGSQATAHEHYGPVHVHEHHEYSDGSQSDRDYTEQGRHPDTYTYDHLDQAVAKLQPAIDGAKAGPGLVNGLSQAAGRIPQPAPRK